MKINIKRKILLLFLLLVVNVFCALAVEYEWEQTDWYVTTYGSITEHTNVIYNDKWCVTAGYLPNEDYMTNTISCVNKTGQFSYIEGSNKGWNPRRNHASVSLKKLDSGDELIYILGGYRENLIFDDEESDVWVYNSSTDSWLELTSSAEWSGRQGHQAIELNVTGLQWLAVMGGYDGSNYLDDIWISDDYGESWFGFINAPWGKRSEFSLTSMGNYYYLIGGENSTDLFDDVWRSENGVNWTKIGTYPSKISQHSTVVYDDKLFVIGGKIDDNVFTNATYYSEDGINWVYSSDFPYTISQHTAINFSGNLYVTGGFDGAYYNAETYIMKEVIPPPPIGINWILANDSTAFDGRSGHTSVIYDDKMWVIGGYDGNDYLNDVWYSIDSINWVEANNSAGFSGRMRHTSVVYDDKMWVIGGLDATNRFHDVWYSTNGIDWILAGHAGFSERASHTSIIFNNKMWVIGGKDDDEYLYDVYYSVNGTNWITATSDAGFNRRSRHALVVYDDKMWVIGGYFWDGSSHKFNDVWYSTNGTDWVEATNDSAFSKRYFFTSVAYDNKMWVIGGDDGNSLNDTWYSIDGINWVEANVSVAFDERSQHTSIIFDDKIWVIGGYKYDYFNDVWYLTYEEEPPEFNNTFPQLVNYNYNLPAPVCYRSVLSDYGGAVEGYIENIYAFNLIDAEGDDLMVAMLYQYPNTGTTAGLKNISGIYSDCFRSSNLSYFVQCGGCGNPWNWQSTLCENYSYENTNDIFLPFNDYNGTDEYNDMLIWTDTPHYENDPLDFEYEAFWYEMAYDNCWYLDDNDTLQYYSTITNALPILSYAYDTGMDKPICLGEDRKYFNFIGKDEEEDEMYVRIFCQSLARGVPATWHLLHEDLELTCNYTNVTGSYTDKIFITDDVNLAVGRTRQYRENFDIALYGCYNQGEEGGIGGDDEITAIWREDLTLRNYKPTNFDYDNCAEYSFFFGICPLIKFIEKGLVKVSNWILEWLLYIIIILLLIVMGIVIFKKIKK